MTRILLIAALTLAARASGAPDVFAHGTPASFRSCQIVDKGAFVVCHSPTWRTPLWVGFRLTRELLEGGAERTNKFYPEPTLAQKDRAELRDYARSGYDRGHMAPASSFKRSVEAMAATFTLANMVPQTPELNRNVWRMIEDCVRALAAAPGHGNIYVFVGPLNVSPRGEPTTWLNGRVAVPSHTFQAIMCDHEGDAEDEFYGFIAPNIRKFPAGVSPNDLTYSVDTIEDLTGIDFFPAAAGQLGESQNRRLPQEALRWRLPGE